VGDVTAAGPVGVVCGLRSEQQAFGATPDRLFGVSGARPERAESETRRLIREGARIVLSVGLAGGLDPQLTPGTLLAPEAVVDADGQLRSADAALLGELERALALDPEAGPAAGGLLYGSDVLVDGVAGKAALHAGTGACAVDMESHRVARVTAEAGVAFAMIRAVGDPASRALPRAAFDAIGEDGRVRPFTTAWSILQRPQDLPALLALGRESKAALTALSRAGAALAR